MGLEADPRVRRLVSGSTTWRDVIHLPTVPSTQDLALQRLREGGRPGIVVVADAQTSGRGRLGRPWRDAVTGPHGPGNLAVTCTITAPAQHARLVPLLAGEAVAEAYRSAGADPRLKWPNDVLLSDRKAAGILVERHSLDAGAGSGSVLLIGCGLNLDWRGVDRADGEGTWTSVAEELGGDVDRVQVLVDLLGAMGSRLQQLREEPMAVLDAYRSSCSTINRVVRIERPGGDVTVGDAVGIDAEGRLVVVADGHRRAIDVGDVLHVRPS